MRTLRLSSVPWVWNVLNPYVVQTVKFYCKFLSLGGKKKRTLGTMNLMVEALTSLLAAGSLVKQTEAVVMTASLNELHNSIFTAFSWEKYLQKLNVG